MLGTKRFALRSRGTSLANPSRLLPLVVALLLAATPRLQAQRLPLPPNEQDAVNKAIDRGMDYLKRSQRKSGTWTRKGEPGAKHHVGYAVLPGLTLLECGVPASDPIIQKTARYLRTWSGTLDTTYELSLGILFLDRLGDPRDKKLIQTFALRLIAGQSATGGWGYKCPILNGPAQKELLTALRHLNRPGDDLPFQVGGRPDLPAIADKPANRPGIPGIARQPGDLAPIAQVPGGLPLGGLGAVAGLPSLTGGISRDPSAMPSQSRGSPGSLSRSGDTNDASRGEAPRTRDPIPEPTDRWRDCLGVTTADRLGPWHPSDSPSAQEDRKAPPPPPVKADAKPDDDKSAPPKSKKPYEIPPRIRMLTVVQDPALHVLQDPKGKAQNLILTTTDNSNTQFAILALWTAQRYDVPMRRTLNLVVRRYLTSQNADGSWGYHYRFGGNEPTRLNTMTCVGLIGLAVGHGLAQPRPAGQPVQDPRIIAGLSALYNHVGQPAKHLADLPMQNLYFLWSVERVAVLYNLPTIGDKDWYRWGAQVLVSNQQDKGNWANGQYHGNTPTIDTCLALLFLKRANLVKDLTAKLPFKAADLNGGIMDSRGPPPDPTPPPSPPEPTKKPLPPVEPPKPEPTDNLVAKPLHSLEGTARDGAANATDAPANEGSSKKKWIALPLILFGVLSGGSVFFVFLVAKRNKRDDEDNDGKRKKRKLPATKSDA
jgi:hypothetical protein